MKYKIVHVLSSNSNMNSDKKKIEITDIQRQV